MKIIKTIVLLILLVFFYNIFQIPTVKAYLIKATLFVSLLNKEKDTIDNVTLYFSDDSQEKTEDIIAIYNELNTLGLKIFSNNSLPKLSVFIVKSNLATNILLKNGNGIYYPEANMIILRRDSDKNSFNHSFTHEYTHFLMVNYLKEVGIKENEIPLWFHEGVAEMFAHKFSPLPFNESINSWESVPLNELWPNSSKEAIVDSKSYIISHFAVERLIKLKGINVVNDLIHNTKVTGDFNKTFKDTTMFDLDNFHLWLIPDQNFIDRMTELVESNSYNDITKEQLEEYDKSKLPYYFEAPIIYNLLEKIYIKEAAWDKAIKVVLERMNYYPTTSVEWNIISNYAYKHGNLSLAIQYAEKAVALSKPDEKKSYNEWLTRLKDETNKGF